MGIADLATLRDYDLAALEAAFGPRIGRLAEARARFEDETPIAVSHKTKSQSTETTFDADVADHDRLADHRNLAEELCRRLRSRHLEGRTIGIKVRLDDWTTVTRSHTVERETNDPASSSPPPSTSCAPTPRPARAPARRADGEVRRGGGRAGRPRPGQMQLGVAAS